MATKAKGQTKEQMIAAADEVQELTLAQVKALPGILGRIASVMVEAHGAYGYVDIRTNRKVAIVRID